MPIKGESFWNKFYGGRLAGFQIRGKRISVRWEDGSTGDFVLDTEAGAYYHAFAARNSVPPEVYVMRGDPSAPRNLARERIESVFKSLSRRTRGA